MMRGIIQRGFKPQPICQELFVLTRATGLTPLLDHLHSTIDQGDGRRIDLDGQLAACGEFGDGVDVLFTPISPTVAFPLGERVQDPLQMYLADVFTVTVNLAGLPAISVPLSVSEGLPVGGQLIAPKWKETTLFRAAFALETAVEAG